MRCPNPEQVATLTSSERQAFLDHASDCDECHAVVMVLDVVPTEPGSDGAVDATDRIDRYVLGRVLGRGAMGVVYVARDSELDRDVALKLLRPSATPLRLRREAQALARLTHPNVVRVYDVGLHEGQAFIAMELVDGRNLREWLQTPHPLDEILSVLVRAAHGLAAAHQAGLVHRDFKPDNVLLSAAGGVMVGDFGLARTAVQFDEESRSPSPLSNVLTATGLVVGTPAYSAPEQAAGEATAASDQYSFCVTAWEACFGERPIGGATPSELRANALAGKIHKPANRAVPIRIELALRRGLSPLPGDRFPSLDALIRALDPPPRRRRWPWVAAIALAAIATVGVVAGIRSAPAARPPRIEQAIAENDIRPGCNCPLSACKAGCVSVCRARGYQPGARVPGVSLPGRQEALVGAATDGNTILYLAGKGCAIDRLLLARRAGATFESVDLTDAVARAGVAIAEGCCTLAPDGRSLIAVVGQQFAQLHLDGSALDTRELDDITAHHLPTDKVAHPVMSEDGLTLYYAKLDPTPDADDPQRTYVATRADRTSRFSPGKPLPGRARGYEYVSGVSSDGLSLFMTSEFVTRVLVRASTSERFGEPSWTTNPARLEGWRAIPLAGCSRILVTASPGGCESEDIIYLDPVTSASR